MRYGKLHAPWYQDHLAGLHVKPAAFRMDVQPALLRHDQQLTVRVVEIAIRHGAVRQVIMNTATDLRCRVAVGGKRHQAVNEISGCVRYGDRVPAHLVGRRRYIGDGTVNDTRLLDRTKIAMGHRRPDAVKPGTPVRLTRGGESGTA